MRSDIFSNITPQKKNISVNDKFGNTGIKLQQGTSVTKYDTLPLDGRTTLNFFEGSQSRPFPLSNCSSEGNKLGVGNSLVIERIHFSILVATQTPQGTIYGLFGNGTIEQPLTAINQNLRFAELNFNIANSTVLKNFPLMSVSPQFNYSATSEFCTVYELDTNIVIPPLFEFVGQVRIPQYVVPTEEEYFLRMTIEGSGSIIAPRTTF
jgi:hypothetical protein